MFNVVLARIDYFQDIYYRNQAVFCFFNDKNLQRRRKFVFERDFLIQNSLLVRFNDWVASVTSKVQSAIKTSSCSSSYYALVYLSVYVLVIFSGRALTVVLQKKS